MEINRKNILEILECVNAKPSKDYGQNFLVEPSICEKISQVLVTNTDDTVLEIGPGLGSLTNFLNKKEGKLECVEIDFKMVSALQTIYKNDQILLLNDDVRKINLEKYTKIIGNLPYNITTELVIFLLTKATKCRQFVFMIQAEALNRFIDLNGKEYGPASIFIHLIGNIKKEFIVKPGSFYPAPKCNSVVFQINKEEKHKFTLCLETYKLAKKLFSNRRKTIFNNMANILGREKAQTILRELNIPETTRPEEISPEMFLNIYNLAK